MHQSFAEYFIAKSISNSNQHNTETKNIIKEIFELKEYFLICKFINDFLSNLKEQEDKTDYFNTVKNIGQVMKKSFFEKASSFIKQKFQKVDDKNQHFQNKDYLHYLGSSREVEAKEFQLPPMKLLGLWRSDRSK